MTRKESKALLQQMRDTGCVIKVEHDFTANPNLERCVCATAICYYKLYCGADKYIYASGAGSWAICNTFADFYDEMRYSTLVEILPSTHYEWGL